MPHARVSKNFRGATCTARQQRCGRARTACHKRAGSLVGVTLDGVLARLWTVASLVAKLTG